MIIPLVMMVGGGASSVSKVSNASNEIKHKREPLPTMDEKCRDFLAGRCTRGLNCKFSHDKPLLPLTEKVDVHTENSSSEIETKSESDFEPALITEKDAKFASSASIPHPTLPSLATDIEETPDEATLSPKPDRSNGAGSLAESETLTGNGTSSTIPDAGNSRPETPNEQTSSEANVLITIDSTDHPFTPIKPQ
jgi:hypothetical protein